MRERLSSFLNGVWAHPLRASLILLFLLLSTAWDQKEQRICLFSTSVTKTGGTCFADSDFISHWVAGWLTVRGQSVETYDGPTLIKVAETETTRDETMPPFRLRGNAYPPTMNLALSPFGLLPLPTAYRIFVLAGAALFLTMAWQWGRGLAVAAAFSFSGAWMCFYAGQNGLFTGGLLGLGFALLSRRPVAAGVCFGLCCVKPQFGLLLPLLLLAGREGRAFFAAALTVLGLVVLSLLWAGGIPAWHAFLTQGADSARNIMDSFHLWPRFQSVYGALRQQGVGREMALAFQAASAVLAVGTAILIWIRTRDAGMRGASALFATLLSLPVVYDYDLPIAMAGVLAFFSAKKGEKFWILAVSPAAAVVYIVPAFFGGLGVRMGSISLVPFALWVLLLACLRLSSCPQNHPTQQIREA